MPMPRSSGDGASIILAAVALAALAPARAAEHPGATARPPATGPANAEAPLSAHAWRITNAEAIDVAWGVRSLQFFRDDTCQDPIPTVPNHTGDVLGTAAAEMTSPEHVYALRSLRGWESVDACAPGECHLGFAWQERAESIRCVVLHQSDDGLHAAAITLQRSVQQGEWLDVTTWRPVDGGRAKLAVSCPGTPEVAHGRLVDCGSHGAQAGECRVECDGGFGTVEPSARCVHGVWYAPECLPAGSLVRLVAHAPDLIKPYWVVLDAHLFRGADCTDAVKMEGSAVSSGEYRIKYANYHPRNAWDGDASTSWASSAPCTPGACYFGFRFAHPPGAVRCVRIEHPQGREYQAASVALEVLGPSGWEEQGRGPGGEGSVTWQLLPPEGQEGEEL